MITDKMIEEYIESHETEIADSFTENKIIFRAIKFAQDKILEMASDGSEEWWEKTFHTDPPLETSNFSRDIIESWQAAKLSSAKGIKKLRKAFDDVNEQNTYHANRMIELQKERAEMKEALIDFIGTIAPIPASLYLDDLADHFKYLRIKHAKLIEKLKDEK